MKGVDVDMAVNRHVVGYDERPQPARVELTERQREALKAVASGLTLDESARALFLSRAVVASALRAARARLGARNTAQAVLLAERAGLLAEDGCE